MQQVLHVILYRVSCDANVLTKFFVGYDRAVRPDFRKCMSSKTRYSSYIQKTIHVKLVQKNQWSSKADELSTCKHSTLVSL